MKKKSYKMFSAFFVSSKLTEILNIWKILLLFGKLEFINISVNFEVVNMVNLILEFLRLVQVIVINPLFFPEYRKIMFFVFILRLSTPYS